MIGSAIGDVLPMAVGVAVSPVPVIALILMLFSKHARSNGPAFALGWLVGIAAVGAIVLAVSGAGDVSTESGPSTVASVVQLGERAARVLDELKTWLSRNNATVMSLLLLVFGTVLLGKGIGGLTS